MKDIFKKGDRVFHIQYGWGTIHEVISDMYVFDKGGKYLGFPTKNNKTLSFTEYTLNGFSQERPEELPKVGQIVWVKDYESEEWHIRYFVHKHNEEYYVTSRNPYAEKQNGSYYKYLTTTNPYENEQ